MVSLFVIFWCHIENSAHQPGTVYIQRSDPYLIVPAMGVFSCASGMFVFPAIELYFSPAIKLYRYEKANGVGQAQDLVLQGFSKYVTIAFFPVLLSTSMMYLLVRLMIVDCDGKLLLFVVCLFSCLSSAADPVHSVFLAGLHSSAGSEHLP